MYQTFACYCQDPCYVQASSSILIARNLTPQNLEEPERFWITDAQKSMKSQPERGYFNRMCPSQETDGIIKVGGRVERCVQISYGNQKLVLLPYNHRFSRLFAGHVHNEAHLGNAVTVSKICLRFWIVNLGRMVKSIGNRCITCGKNKKRLQEQLMAPLPVERLKPCPAWNATALDFLDHSKPKEKSISMPKGKLMVYC